MNTGNIAIVHTILEDIVQHTLCNLHSIEKSLTFWLSRAERGPRAFVEATCQTLNRLTSFKSPSDYLLDSACDMIRTKHAGLTSIQHCLAAFLAEVYSETSKCVEGLTESSDKSLYNLFVVLNTVFSKLETSIRNSNEGQNLVNTHDRNSCQLLFEKLPEFDIESSQWTEAISTNAISLIYQNLEKLDIFVSSQVSSHKKPSRMTIYWLPYTCGAIGLSACSLWLLRHSSLVGSSNMDNWIRCSKESVTIFQDKPTSSLGDERLQTFETTDELTVKKQKFQQTEESLNRYDEESAPIQNEFDGELPLAMLIQIEKRLAYQKADLALLRDQLQKIEILAALPTYGVPLLLIYLARALVMHVQKGRRRTARRQRWERWGLLRHVESCMVNQMKEDASCKFGLALYKP